MSDGVLFIAVAIGSVVVVCFAGLYCWVKNASLHPDLHTD